MLETGQELNMPEPTINIRNKTSGEVKTIPLSQAGNFGIPAKDAFDIFESQQKLQQVVETGKIPQEKKGPESGADAKVIAAAKSGLGSVARAKEALKGFGGNIALFGASTDLVPFTDSIDITPWGRGLESDLFNAVDVILRQRSGAAVPPEEVRRYVKQKGPRVTDPAKVKTQKLNAIQSELEDVITGMGQEVPGLDKDDEDLINKYKNK